MRSVLPLEVALPVTLLYLTNQPLPRAVVSLTLTPAAELYLVPLEVRLRLLYLDERLYKLAVKQRSTTKTWVTENCHLFWL